MSLVPTYLPPAGLRTRSDDFRELVNRKYGLHLATYWDLHEFSVTRLNDFWLTIWDYTDVKAAVHPSKAIDDDAPIDQFPTFFDGARLNFAENLLAGRESGLAVVNLNEGNLSHAENYTWQELREVVRLYADALTSSGLKQGQVVALVGSNCVRSLALLLATASVGAIFSSFATDMGAKALNDRLQLLQPRFLFAESTYSYNGKRHDVSSTLAVSIKALQKNGKTDAIIIGPRENLDSPTTSFDDFLARGTGRTLTFAQVPFHTPFVIMFSSGTTGTPKGIVHSQGGLALIGLKEYYLHNDLGYNDVAYQYTNIGWTLWNISIGALFVGATLVLYDGSPFYPTPEGFLRTLFEHRITSFGAGPRYYSELQKLNIKPREYAGHLHTIISTGAVLTSPLAQWLAEAFGPVCQISMSGGTEISGAFLHGTRSLPSYPGELAVRGLGFDIDVFSADGKPLPDGESGELVCKKPFPNMPAMFWKDPGRQRYFKSYFAGFPHIWTHGDFIRVNPETKGLYVLGRSDGVLNPSGVRFGSSEIYNILGAARFHGLVVDALVVGQQRIAPPYADPAEQVILFIKCAPSVSTHTWRVRADLEAAIRDQIAQDLSRRHVPTHIFESELIPYNANGKKLEIQVKAILGEGAAALQKLKLTPEELRQVKLFEPFYEIEKVVARLDNEGPRSKL